MPAPQRRPASSSVQQGVFINGGRPRAVLIRMASGFILASSARADEVLRLRRQGQVEGDDVALGENLVGGGAG